MGHKAKPETCQAYFGGSDKPFRMGAGGYSTWQWTCLPKCERKYDSKGTAGCRAYRSVDPGSMQCQSMTHFLASAFSAFNGLNSDPVQKVGVIVSNVHNDANDAME